MNTYEMIRSAIMAGAQAKIFTRDGREVLDLTHFPNGLVYKFSGTVDGEVLTWTEDGMVLPDGRTDPRDIFRIGRRYTKNVGVWRSRNGTYAIRELGGPFDFALNMKGPEPGDPAFVCSTEVSFHDEHIIANEHIYTVGGPSNGEEGIVKDNDNS